MNLPTAITVGRIAITPLIAALPFVPTAWARFTAFVLVLIAVNSDWLDGYLARSRKQETDLGRLLDPLADKLLLVGSFVPMFLLAKTMPFQTPIGSFGLPLWVVVIIIGRELTMTLFRQYALRRGVVISASWPAKWKTGVTSVWQCAAYCWFWLSTWEAGSAALRAEHWATVAIGVIGALAMAVGVTLTLVSLALYAHDYRKVLSSRPS
jgi:CDP-diacylglycerol--glycerol-3-phosphate 3-phosphatidyltransferase